MPYVNPRPRYPLQKNKYASSPDWRITPHADRHHHSCKRFWQCIFKYKIQNTLYVFLSNSSRHRLRHQPSPRNTNSLPHWPSPTMRQHVFHSTHGPRRSGKFVADSEIYHFAKFYCLTSTHA